MIFNFFKKILLDYNKKSVITKLKKASMKTLILQMNNKEVFSPIVKERQRKEGNYSSKDEIAWYAYRISDDLNNPAYKSELLELLNDSNFQNYRSNIFRCLGSICSNTTDYELFAFLTKQIEFESEERVIVSILSRLDKLIKPENLDIRIIKSLAIDGTYDIRKEAVHSLANSQDKEVEDLLINEFKVSDKHMKGMICTPLRSVGTEKSIPVLKAAYKETRDPFLRWAIPYTLDEIEKRGYSSR